MSGPSPLLVGGERGCAAGPLGTAWGMRWMFRVDRLPNAVAQPDGPQPRAHARSAPSESPFREKGGPARTPLALDRNLSVPSTTRPLGADQCREPPPGGPFAPPRCAAELGQDGYMKIIVGVDGSQSSTRAVEWCAAHAAALGAEVVAVYSIDMPVYVGNAFGYLPLPVQPEPDREELHDVIERGIGARPCPTRRSRSASWSPMVSPRPRSWRSPRRRRQISSSPDVGDAAASPSSSSEARATRSPII